MCECSHRTEWAKAVGCTAIFGSLKDTSLKDTVRELITKTLEQLPHVDFQEIARGALKNHVNG